MLKKIFFKTAPFISAFFAGIILQFIADWSKNYHDLLINISSAFISIPLLYILYESIKSFSHKKLNKEIFEYAKMQIDEELLSILNHLRKIIFSIDETNFSEDSYDNLLKISKESAETIFKKNIYLGFQIFKLWNHTEKRLQDLLKNSFIIEKMSDNEVIAIIKILKCISNLDNIQKFFNLYISTGEKSESYKIINSGEINYVPELSEMAGDKLNPMLFILLKKLPNSEGLLVVDFGLFNDFGVFHGLDYYKISDKFIRPLTYSVVELIKSINLWLELTGFEFIVNKENFRIQPQVIKAVING